MSKKAALTTPIDCSTSLIKMGSSNLQMGIVGMPNVGKSSLFNLLTRMSVPSENFPFCTIDPNVSRIEYPDERFDWLCSLFKPFSKVPAYLQITDIAGLVKGASAGLGLGNNFLSHIQAVDGIYNMIRTFDNEEIIHVEDSVDPVRDMDIIVKELIAKDIENASKNFDGLSRTCKNKAVDKSTQTQLDAYTKVIELLKSGKQARYGVYTNGELEHVRDLRLLTSKPAVYLVNLSQEDYIRKKNKYLVKIKTWIDENAPGSPMIPMSVAFEQALAEIATPEEKLEFEKSKSCTSAISKIAKIGFQQLQLINFFTSGGTEVRSWTIQKGSTAPFAAGAIHSDMQKGFIMCEVMGYEAFHELKSEAACKAAGKYLSQGKNYVVQDGDICFFKFNKVADQKKK